MILGVTAVPLAEEGRRRNRGDADVLDAVLAELDIVAVKDPPRNRP